MNDANAPRSLDRLGLEVLSDEECWRLVGSAPVGRVAVVAAGQPVILPINHLLVGHHVVFLTAPGTKLSAAVVQQPIAFEVDAWNAKDRHGWSVIVEGVATLVTDPTEIHQLDALGLEPWAGSDQQTEWVKIMPHDISGRIVRGALHAEVTS